MNQPERKSFVSPAVKVLTFLGAALMLPTVASAALGEDVGSIAREEEAMQGVHSMASTQAYDVHELVSPAGVRVREYVDQAGRVFAVTWDGPRLCDLRQLLGAYYARYGAEVKTHRTGHHVLSIETPDFVVSAVRFPRSFAGQALLPAHLPFGVSRKEIR